MTDHTLPASPGSPLGFDNHLIPHQNNVTDVNLIDDARNDLPNINDNATDSPSQSNQHQAHNHSSYSTSHAQYPSSTFQVHENHMTENAYPNTSELKHASSSSTLSPIDVHGAGELITPSHDPDVSAMTSPKLVPLPLSSPAPTADFNQPPSTSAYRTQSPRRHYYSRSWAPPSAAMRSYQEPTHPPQKQLHPTHAKNGQLLSRRNSLTPVSAEGHHQYSLVSESQLFSHDPSRSNSPGSPSISKRIWTQIQHKVAGLAPGKHSRSYSASQLQTPRFGSTSMSAGNSGNATAGRSINHMRSASSVAATALASLRESLRAAGHVSRGVRRPSRSAARQNFVSFKPPSLEQKTYIRWVMQLESLARKHSLVMLRGTPILLLMAILGPALAVWLSAVSFQFLSGTLSRAVFPSAADLKGSTPFPVTLPECLPTWLYCRVSVMYSPNDAYHSRIMEEVSKIANLKIGDDVWGYANATEMMDNYYTRNRSIQRRPRHYLIQFNTFVSKNQQLERDPLKLVDQLNGTWYTLGEGNGNPVGTYYDSQIPRDYGITKGTMLSFKKILDTAIINVRSGRKHAVSLNVATFPKVSVPDQVREWSKSGGNGTVVNNGMSLGPDNDGSQVTNDPIASNKLLVQRNQLVILSHYASNIITACLFSIGGFPSMLLLVNVLSQDKYDGMLGTLRQMNLYESAYWISIFVVSLVINGIAACVALIPAVAADYPPINLTHPAYLFLVLFLYGIAMSLVGSLIAVACSSSPNTTSVMTVMTLALTALTLFILSLTDLNQLTLNPTLTPWWLRFTPKGTGVESQLFYLMALLPFFHLGRGMGFALDFTWRGSSSTIQSAQDPSSLATVYSNTYGFQLTFSDAFSTSNSSIAFSSVMWLTLLTFASIFLSWYMNQVTAMTHHWRKPWYFPFVSLFQVNRGLLPLHSNSDCVELREIGQSFSVSQPGICRPKKHITVLDGVSLSLSRGVCHGLLGHNGAGKSTLLDILVGSVQAKSGMGHVFGAAIGSWDARKKMGVCPQVDVAIASLTGREHLRLWAQFRGIPRAAIEDYIASLLTSVSLLDKADLTLERYSGGMRRRMSILSAIIGSPELVVLDEVSNGLDPVQRRHVWEIVASLKSRGVAVLITSHSTQEIQTLSDDVVVLAAPGGKVVLHRNLMELRHEQASIEILITLPNPHDAFTHFPKALYRSCRVITSHTAHITIARSDFPHIARFLETPPIVDWELYSSLESYIPPQPDTEVHNGTGLTIHVQNVSGDQEDRSNVNESLGGMPKIPLDNYALVTTFHQVYGMLRKNIQLQLRQVKHNVFFLLLFLAVMVSLSLLVSIGSNNACAPSPDGKGPRSFYNIRDPETNSPTCNIEPLKTSLLQRLLNCQPSTSNLCSVPDYAALKQTRYHTSITSPPRIWVRSPSDLHAFIQTQETITFLGTNNSRVDMGAMARAIDSQFANVATLPPVVLQRIRLVRLSNTTSTDWAQSIIQAQDQAVNSAPKNIQEARDIYPQECLNLAINSGARPILNNVTAVERLMESNFPDYTLDIQDRSAVTESRKLNIDLRYWETSPYPFVGAMFRSSDNNECSFLGAAPSLVNWGPTLGRLVGSDPSIPGGDPRLLMQTSWPLTNAEVRRNFDEGLWLLDGPVRHIVSSAMNTIARSAVGPGEVIFSDYASIPDLQFATRDEMLLNALMCVLIWLFFTIFILIPMAEHGRFLAFYRVNSLSLFAYWSSQYLFCMLYAVPFLIVLGATVSFIYPNTNGPSLILSLLLSTHAVIGVAFLYTAVSIPMLGGSREMAQFLAYLIPLCVALPCVLWVYADVLSVPITLSTGNLAFPGVAIAFALRIVMQNYDLEFLPIAYGWLFGTGAVCFILCVFVSWLQTVSWAHVYSSTVNMIRKTPSYEGVSRDLHSPETTTDLETTDNFVAKPTTGHVQSVPPISIHNSTPVLGSSMSLRRPTPTFSSIPPVLFNKLSTRSISSPNLVTIDSEVLREAGRVHTAENSVILFDGVSKSYHGVTEPIVEDISFAVGQRESFGLLGPSGSGKTHCVNMITSQLQPSVGIVRTQGRLGLCPQDNVLLDDLTVLDNLQFYAHLKGYSVRLAGPAARCAGHVVGLSPFLNQSARTLSGGMKRRVSLGIALLGNPNTLICDEPTTALDVHHQKNIWRILATLRDRGSLALFLVTHDMQEAQYLCHRVAIMAHSRIQCIGSVASLKLKYGNAWRLILQCPRLGANEVRDWVATLPSVVYASYAHAAASAKLAYSSGSTTPVFQSADTIVLSAAEAAKVDGTDLIASASGFELPQVVETTLTDVIPPFASKIKLEFCIPRVQLPPHLESNKAAMTASSGAALAALVRAVSAEATMAGVSEWSVDTCSLEDVFLRVTTGSIAA